jgi:hypothetical protein
MSPDVHEKVDVEEVGCSPSGAATVSVDNIPSLVLLSILPPTMSEANRKKD